MLLDLPSGSGVFSLNPDGVWSGVDQGYQSAPSCSGRKPGARKAGGGLVRRHQSSAFWQLTTPKNETPQEWDKVCCKIIEF